MWSLLSKGPSVVFVSTVLRCWLGCWVLAHTTLGLQLNACKSYGIVSSFGPGSTVRFGTPFWLERCGNGLGTSFACPRRPWSDQCYWECSLPNNSAAPVQDRIIADVGMWYAFWPTTISLWQLHRVVTNGIPWKIPGSASMASWSANLLAMCLPSRLTTTCGPGSASKAPSMASNYLYAKWMVHSNAAWNFTESWAGGNDPSLPFVCETFLLASWARTGFILAPSTFGFCCFKTLTTIRSPSFWVRPLCRFNLFTCPIFLQKFLLCPLLGLVRWSRWLKCWLTDTFVLGIGPMARL